MCRPMWRCMVTEAIRSRMVWVITGVLALLVLLALPAKAESADYETTLDRLGRLQALAEQYIEEKNSGDDPIDLTLSFTRVGDYNTTIWQLTAGTRDGEFEKYATDADPDLWDLQGMNTVELPNGGEPYAITVDLSGIGRMLKWAGFILLTVQIISLIASLLLALVNGMTAPVIAENTKRTTLAAYVGVLPSVSDASELEEVTDYTTAGITGVVKAPDGSTAIKAEEKGFDGGILTVIMGFDANGAETGIWVDASTQTKGIGSNVSSDDFLAQFDGMDGTQNIVMNQDYDAYSGATISSTALFAAINDCVNCYNELA